MVQTVSSRLVFLFVLSCVVGACIKPTPVSQCNDAAFKIEAEFQACEVETVAVDCESFRDVECEVQPYLDCLVEQVKCEDGTLNTGDPASCANLLECALGNASDSGETGPLTGDTTGDTTGEATAGTTG